MKKILIHVLASAMLLLSPLSAYAAEKPVEVPDIKFMVDMQPVRLSDVPLGLGGRTLLPLRAVLVSLGVPNDDEHIKWNGNDSSVTVNNNGKTIYLKLGNNTARINGEAVKLDVAPLAYAKNQRVYIPVRFISNALDKEVVWDGSSRTVFVRDRNGYSAMESIIDKIGKAMDGVEKVRLSSKTELDITKKSMKVKLDIGMQDELDKKSGIYYSTFGMTLFGKDIVSKTFYRDNTEYACEPDGTWQKTAMTDNEFKEILSENVSLAYINSIEVMAASLVMQDTAAEGEYHLKGKLYSRGIADDICKKTGIGSLTPDDCSFEAVIDKDSDLVRTLHVEFSGKAISGASVSSVSAVINVEYSDYNGTFKIKTPDGL